MGKARCQDARHKGNHPEARQGKGVLGKKMIQSSDKE
jgi:hypothetical protein